ARVERGGRAEDVGAWARAAAYYGASRIQHDTAAARWGVALARERLPERKTIASGPPGGFTDVDVAKDGTVLALEKRGKEVRVYEAVTGRTLWKGSMETGISSARMAGGGVSPRGGARGRGM